jgi:AhpD family alkylhydroperoxidase
MTESDNEASSAYSPTVEELVAIGAAVACNCETCFKHHLREALTRGVSRGDVALAVATARRVREHAAEHVSKSVGEQLAAAREVGPAPGSCCCSKSASAKQGK